MVYPHQFVWISCLGFLFGVAIGSHWALPIVPLVLAIILVGVVMMLRPQPVVLAVAVFVCASLLGWWRAEVSIAHRPKVSDLTNQTVSVVGKIVSDPVVSGNQQTLHLAVSQVNKSDRSFKVVLTAWHLPQFSYGGMIEGKVKLDAPKDSDEFKYSNYLAKDNIYLSGRQVGELSYQPTNRPTLLGSLYTVKNWLNRMIHQFIPEPHSGLLAGLLLGIKVDLSDSFKTALRNSGTSHIVALSGFNLTVIISFLLILLKRLPRRLVWLLSGLMILGFVIMTGAASSVVRAAIMGWLMLLAGLMGRRRHVTNAILLAATTMVLLHPNILLYDVGFQLSLAATAGLIYLSPLLQPTTKYIPQFMQEAFAATLGATIFTLPLIALYFGGLSWVSLFANLIVVPLVPYVMLVGFVGLIGFVLTPTLHWLNLLVWPLSSLLLSTINWFGNLPSAFVSLPPTPIWMPVVYYLGLSWLITYLYHLRRHVKTTL